MKRKRPEWLLIAGLALTLGAAPPSRAPAPGRFSDVPPNHWAANAVNELAVLGILVGYPASPPARKHPAPLQTPRPTPARRAAPRRPAPRRGIPQR